MGFCSAVFSPNTSTLQRCLKKRSPGLGTGLGFVLLGSGFRASGLGFRDALGCGVYSF